MKQDNFIQELKKLNIQLIEVSTLEEAIQKIKEGN